MVAAPQNYTKIFSENDFRNIFAKKGGRSVSITRVRAAGYRKKQKKIKPLDPEIVWWSGHLPLGTKKNLLEVSKPRHTSGREILQLSCQDTSDSWGYPRAKFVEKVRFVHGRWSLRLQQLACSCLPEFECFRLPCKQHDLSRCFDMHACWARDTGMRRQRT